MATFPLLQKTQPEHHTSKSRKSQFDTTDTFLCLSIQLYRNARVTVSEALWETVSHARCPYQSICGVPYTALPLATIICANHKYPMLIKRKEAKDYGTKKMIEGRYQPGDTCLIVEDVVTSGTSVLETVQALKKEGIDVRDAVVLLDREQGGSQRLTDNGITLHSVCSISKLLEVLEAAGRLDAATAQSVRDFVTSNSTYTPPQSEGHGKQEQVSSGNTCSTRVLTYEDRRELATHPLSKSLFDIMISKKTNLAFSVDVTSSSQLLELADKIGPHICILKTHMDIVDDFTPDTVIKLKKIAACHNFLIFEDRKFADIGNTVKLQYSSGVHKISDWADIVNAHALPGPGIIEGLQQVGGPLKRGCLLLAEMSSEGCFATKEYTEATVTMAEEHADFVMGFICQNRISENPGFVHMTPGVRLTQGGDNLGQQYLTPQEVIKCRQSDVIIVGRGILSAENQVSAAKLYQEAGYTAFEELLQEQ